MIEVKNLVKVYKSKTGVMVKALDDVSLTLPEKGMVFILGKSGSGKSTLLNVLGGLDSFDSGKIFVKGKETEGFKQADYDSYRNTYVGFIFQEYNLLEDFSVGANIALAIELQGRKATDEEINEILHTVDLDGLGARKPNELSGGQKQRVAIARALVKKPEIIMADEPTGALDSKTGKQVFDTLKELSTDKLVLIVSHDKDFAMGYADRIIELADGKIIDDISNSGKELKQKDENIIYTENEIIVKPSYHLTSKDLEMINNYLEGKKDNISIKSSYNTNKSVHFVKTDEDSIITNNSGYQLIKSKLSVKNSFRIGKTGLNHKKVKLVITILLAVISFTLFGLSDVIASYDKVSTYIKSIQDSNITYATFVKEEKHSYFYDEDDFFWSTEYLTDDEVFEIENKTGVDVIPVFNDYCSLDYSGLFPRKNALNKDEDLISRYLDLYPSSMNGFAEVNSNRLEEFGYEIIAGRLPEADDEICISKYAAETFMILGKLESYDEDGNEIVKKYSDYSELLNEEFEVRFYHEDLTLKLCGIIDTHFDYSKYESLLQEVNINDSAKYLAQMLLADELSSIQENTLFTACFVRDGFVGRMRDAYYNGTYVKDVYIQMYVPNSNAYMYPFYVFKMDKFTKEIHYISEEKESLNENEIIISFNSLREIYLDILRSSKNIENVEQLVEMVESMDASSTNAQTIIDMINEQDNGFLNRFIMSYHNFLVNESEATEKSIKIVGIGLYSTFNDYIIVSDELYGKFILVEPGYYSFATGSMPSDKGQLENIVKQAIDESNDTRYALVNNVSYELNYINEILKVLGKVFLYVGLFFGLFASLMLANFIATSISYKRHDIGILRAIGARFIDVFKIFFSESLIIGAINFIFSTVSTLAVSVIINEFFREDVKLAITVLNFSIRQVGLLLGVSLIVALISTILPVLIHASRKPINAIRDR